jgi:hypothetical protein
MAVNPGLFKSIRTLYRRSFDKNPITYYSEDFIRAYDPNAIDLRQPCVQSTKDISVIRIKLVVDKSGLPADSISEGVIVETLKQNAKSAVRRARPWIRSLARLGYVAKGIVYLIIGLMAARFALGRSSNPGDFSSALLQVFRNENRTGRRY